MIAYLITNSISGRQYVGITTRSIEARWIDHQRRRSNSIALRLAIAKYGAEAFVVEHIASACSLLDLKALERILIVQHGTLSPGGYNLTGGGDGVFNLAPEVRARQRAAISAAQKGKKQSASTIAARAAGLIGHAVSDETKAKIGARNRGSVHTASARAKMSAAKMGRPQTPEHIAKATAARIGILRTPEWRAAIAASKGTPEARARARDGMLGKKHSEEARAKMRKPKSP